jgi:predicted O-methyltransferase YrrM
MSVEPTMSGVAYPSPLIDPRVRAVLDRLHELSGRTGPKPGGGDPGFDRTDPFSAAHRALSIRPEQGDLIYLLCRAIGARRAVDFATSFGISAIYSAAAIRDNGGGTVIGAEIVPEKIATAERNLAEAGLAEFAGIRPGDARETLRDLGGPVDFALIDGFPVASGPSLALQVFEVVAPQLRIGALVMNDNGESDYLELVRDPASGFRSLALPLKGSTELSVKVG